MSAEKGGVSVFTAAKFCMTVTKLLRLLDRRDGKSENMRDKEGRECNPIYTDIQLA